MKKKIAVLVAMVVALFFLAPLGVSAATYGISVPPVKVVPVGEKVNYSVVVMEEGGKLVSAPAGIIVNCFFTESQFGELDEGNIVQRETNEEGEVTFQIPLSEEDIKRYLSVWVDGNMPAVQHLMLWYTSDESMPARIVPEREEVSLFPRRMSIDVVFFVFNAWGVPLSEVFVTIVEGQEKLYYPDLTTVGTYPFAGAAIFGFSVGEEIKGTIIFRVRVDRCPFLEAQTRVSWDDS